MVNNNFDHHIKNGLYDNTSKVSPLAHATKNFFKIVGVLLGNLVTLGLLGAFLTLKDQRKINQLRLGQGGSSLVQAQRKKIAQLNEQIASRQNLFDILKQTEGTKQETPYKKTDADPENIEGPSRKMGHRYYAKGLTIDPIDQPDATNEDFIANSTPEALLKSAFEHIHTQLTQNPEYHFSKNRDIRNKDYAYQRSAVVKLMILDLIEEAELKVEACGEIYLYLNNQDNLKEFAQCPEKILRKRQDGSLETTEAYLEQTAFTPLNSGTVKGLIDPLGVKWTLAKMSDQEKAALKTLLSDALYADDTQQLIAAKALLAGNKNLKYVFSMIERISAGVEERYKKSLNAFWKHFSNHFDGNLPVKKIQEAQKAVTRNVSKTVSLSVSQKKTNEVTRSAFRTVALFFLSLATLGIYSLIKYINQQHQIEGLDPATRHKKVLSQQKLYGEIKQLKDQLKNSNNLGPVHEEDEIGRYQKRPADPDTLDFQPGDDDESLDAYIWRLPTVGTLDNTTMEGLFVSAFGIIHEKLVEKAQVWRQIQFSRNEEWAMQTDKHTVLTRMMVLELIQKARIIHENGEHKLNLNTLLEVGRSMPERVSKIVDGKEVQELVYLNNDPWTPPAIRSTATPVMRGIDPIGIKWILEQLSHEEMEHLERLLLDEYIPDYDRKNPEIKDHIGSKALFDTKNWIRKNPESPRVKLVRQALHLIKEVALSLDNRYSKLFVTLWKKFSNEESDKNGALPPVKKQEDDLAPVDPGAIVAWQPNVDLPAGLKANFEAMQKRVQIISEHMSRNLLQNPANSSQEGQVYAIGYDHPTQFVVKHAMPGRGGCLYGALTALLFQDVAKVTAENTNLMMKAMAAYLKDHREDFAESIRADLRGATVQQLIDFLDCGDYTKQHPTAGSYSNVDAEIFAHTFGVKVQIFGNTVGVKVVNGLPQTKTKANCPNTKETLYLINKGSWYAMAPDLKAPAPGDTSELAQAIRKHREYWNGPYSCTVNGQPSNF